MTTYDDTYRNLDHYRNSDGKIEYSLLRDYIWNPITRVWDPNPNFLLMQTSINKLLIYTATITSTFVLKDSCIRHVLQLEDPTVGLGPFILGTMGSLIRKTELLHRRPVHTKPFRDLPRIKGTIPLKRLPAPGLI